MLKLTIGLVMLGVGGLLVTVGGYLAKDGWDSLKKITPSDSQPTSDSKLQITISTKEATLTVSAITEGIDSFNKTAVDFVDAIEKNMDAFYRIEDKIKARRQLDHIERVLSLFPQIWFFNGIFASAFLVGGSSAWVDTRDKETLDAFRKALNDAELAFSKNAPRVSELGSEITLLFNQQIQFRRQLIELAEVGHIFNESDVEIIRRKLKALESVEDRFRALSRKYQDDKIREFAAEHPVLGAEEIAKKLDLWPPRRVERALNKD